MDSHARRGIAFTLRLPDRPVSETPWMDQFFVDFTGPAGESLRVPGFYNGDGYRVRVSLPAAGRWIWQADAGSGELECLEGTDLLKGGLAVDAEHPHRFSYRDGSPCFLLSYECNWLWALEQESPGEGRPGAFLRKIRANGFNAVLMNLFAFDCTWNQGNTEAADFGPPPMIPWEGRIDSPDFQRYNADFWRHMDSVVEAFQDEGVFLHLYFKVFNKMVTWPEAGGAEEEAWFYHAVARYQAYSCMIWDFSKETYYELDKTLIRRRMTQVGEWDAYKRLRTTNDDLDVYSDPEVTDYLDFQTVQQHHDYHTTAVLENLRHSWPYVNAEFGYECGPGGIEDVTYGAGQLPDELVRRAWAVALGGGYPTFYYTFSAWDVIHEDADSPGHRYFGILGEFFRSVDYASFTTEPRLTLWRNHYAMVKGTLQDPEEVIYFMEEHVLTPPQVNFDDFRGTWLNIYTGERRDLTISEVEACVDRPEYTIFTRPFYCTHSVLHLTRRQEA